MIAKLTRLIFSGSPIPLNDPCNGDDKPRRIRIVPQTKPQSIFQVCLFSAVCFLAWIGAGCTGGPASLPTIVCGTCEEPGRFVRLQTQYSRSTLEEPGEFSHPVQLRPQDWQPILASVRVRPVINFLRKGEGEPAFTPEEIDYLSMTLSRAFAKASSKEWVVFGLKISKPAPVPKMTTGAWYFEGTTLHLLLSNYHAPVPLDNLTEVLGRDPLFEVLEATRYEILPTTFSVDVSGGSSSLSFLRQETPHLAIEYQNLLAEGTGEVKPDGTIVPSSSISDRLATLKRLKEQHLISEEDFQRKKRELLDQF